MLWLFSAIGGMGRRRFPGLRISFGVRAHRETGGLCLILTLFSLTSFALCAVRIGISFRLRAWRSSGIGSALCVEFAFFVYRFDGRSVAYSAIGWHFLGGYHAVSADCSDCCFRRNPGFRSSHLLFTCRSRIALFPVPADAGIRRVRSGSYFFQVCFSGFYLLIKVGEGSGANFVRDLFGHGFVFLRISLCIIPVYRRDMVAFVSRDFCARDASLSSVDARLKDADAASANRFRSDVAIFISGKISRHRCDSYYFATYRGPVSFVLRALLRAVRVRLSPCADSFKEIPGHFSERISRANGFRKIRAFILILAWRIWFAVRGSIRFLNF